MSLADSYFASATALLARAREKNAPTLKALGPLIGKSIAAGGVLHTFGSGHSELIGREIIGRAGGLMPVTGLIDPGYGFSENVVGYGTRLAERHDNHYHFKAGESIVVISNSGKNSSPIEVALYAQKKGVHVIALTSLEMSTTSKTVHPGGKNLHAIADHTLDNLGVTGDAITEVAPGRFAGPTSTLIGATLLNLLTLEVLDWLQTHGHPLPLVTSQNIPGGMEANIELSQKYRTRLSKLIG
ncbi:MAG: sugar isomerase domain-containing protein [Opitutaceae bacterium]|jgi:uncharacterized phosphosugar-binding protein